MSLDASDELPPSRPPAASGRVLHSPPALASVAATAADPWDDTLVVSRSGVLGDDAQRVAAGEPIPFPQLAIGAVIAVPVPAAARESPLALEPGDRVIWREQRARELWLEGEQFFVVQRRDIVTLPPDSPARAAPEGHT